MTALDARECNDVKSFKRKATPTKARSSYRIFTKGEPPPTFPPLLFFFPFFTLSLGDIRYKHTRPLCRSPPTPHPPLPLIQSPGALPRSGERAKGRGIERTRSAASPSASPSQQENSESIAPPRRSIP